MADRHESPARAQAVLAPTSGSAPRRDVFLAGSAVVFAALLVYHNSFSGPFIFDDAGSITANPSIHGFESALSPPANQGVGGRPMLNLTFALNYAWGGMSAWGYHAVNLLIHALAGLVLFGLVRRTLTSRLAPRRSQITDLKSKIMEGPATAQAEISNLKFQIVADATLLALAVAVIWTVHPLQTEAVTYVSQRAESLMGLFYLLTLYGFVRGAEAGKSRAESQESRGTPVSGSQLSTPCSGLWLVASILFCLLGGLCKEVIVTVPLMVLFYDRTFVAGSFREAWRGRWRYYLGLAGTWLSLAWQMTDLGQRNVGFGQGVTWWHYALTSGRSVVLYLKLAVWPHPLVFDYGTEVVQHATEIAPYALVLIVVVAATAVAWRRWPALGFAGAWFFVILAPTSSIVPIAEQPMAEHRMYLPLAATVAMGVLGCYAWLGRRSLIIFAAAAVGLGWLTIQRNKDYRSDLAIWSDTVAKCPDNARAHNHLGYAFTQIPGRLPEAISEYETALRIDPHYVDSKAHYNLGLALDNVGRISEAIAQFEETVRIEPGYAEAYYNLGTTLGKTGRIPEAIVQLEEAVRLKPDYAEAHNNLGIALYEAGRIPEAMAQCKEALRIKPDFADARALLEKLQQAAR